MKKRMLSLLCVLALCLGLLPTTALAAGESDLYVSGQLITESGCYENQDGTWTKVDGAEPASGQFYYDTSTATLTLNNVSIVGGAFDGTTLGAGICAKTKNEQALSVTINLIGTNTVSGSYGIYVSGDGDSDLIITGSGSLSAEGTGNGYGVGIQVSSSIGYANLTINGVDVSTANGSDRGIYFRSGTNNSNAALTVNGGKLTVSADYGITYQIGSNAGGGIPSLTVTDNAVVDVQTGGFSINSTAAFQVGAGGENTGGIVWNGSNGTVYGDVTLDEPLTIDQGETLTIPEGATLNTNGNLNNDGTIVNKGTMNGDPTGGSGTVVSTPTITTESLPDGTVDRPYTATLEATGNDITWSLDSGTLPAGLTLNSDGTITGTPSAEDSSTFTVKAENSAGFTTTQYTLNIKPATVSVTGVKLDTDKLDLFTGESETLIATVEPANATNQDVTWSSNNNAVATVENGTVTAVKEGEATITVTTDDGGKTATCAVKVTDPVYSMTTDLATLDFGSVYTGYAQPAAQTVTITNTGNQTLNLNQPASTTSFEVGTLSKTKLAPGEKATFTVQPKAGLAAGVYREEIQVSDSGNATLSIPVSFSVQAAAAPQVTPAPAATPAPSDNITYYTCPSCGYHNWTATDAGYRCDHCGYLESTRQLSGYGNVKGSYTPGSSAAAPAASTIPQTGDESNPVLWTVLLLVSGLALGGLAIAKRKKQQ